MSGVAQVLGAKMIFIGLTVLFLAAAAWSYWASGAIEDKRAHGAPTIEDVVADYCQRTGRSGLPDLNWYFAYNIFRLAGIVQGIVGRARDGTANSPQAAAMAARVPALGAAAWKFAEKAGA